MRACLFAPQTWTYGAALAASTAHAAFPATHLALDQPRKRWQGLSGYGDNELNATRSDEKRVAGVGLLYTNCHNPHASWRLRIAHAGEIATPWLDTARIFTPGSGDPHLYALRFLRSSSRIDFNDGFADLTSDFTIEAVVRVWYPGGPYTIFRQLTGSNEPVLYLSPDRRLHFDRPGKVTATSAAALSDFTWAHVALVYSASAHEVRLFLNGVRDLTLGSVTAPLGGVDTVLGESTGAGWDLAEFRVWSVARSDADVYANAFSPIAMQTGLVGYWKLTEGGGAILGDEASAHLPGQTDCAWIWPSRLWMSPLLDGLDRTHALWWDDFGGDAGHVRLNIRDELADESAFSAGNLLISDAWRPDINALEGSTPFGFQDAGSRSTTPNGVTNIVPGAPFDARQLNFMSRSHDEMYQLWWRLALGCGNSKPLLYCSDSDDPFYAYQRSIFGVFDGPINFQESKGPIYRVRANMRQMT